MAKYEVDEDKPVLTGVFAHYCGPWEYEKFVKGLFARRGYEMLLPDLPIDDPDATNDDHAAIIRAAQRHRGAEAYVDLGHSWSGDLIFRRLGSVPVLMAVALGSPLREVAENAGIPKDSNSHSVLYSALAKAEESGEADFEDERELIGMRLFGDLGDAALRAWATANLRSHPHVPKSGRPDDKARLPEDMPVHIVGFRNDRVYFYQGQKKLAKDLMKRYPNSNLEFTSIPTGHFPMLEKPELFVDHIITVIERQTEGARRQSGQD